MKTPLFALSIASVLATSLASASVVYTLPATANIFSAGRSVPVAPGGNGAGSLPLQVGSPVGTGNGFQFSITGGSVSAYYNLYNLQGEGISGTPTSINAYQGLSGYLADHAFPLTGVFLSDATPQDPAPATLDFRASGLGENFLTLSPQVGQIFFIGDGKTAGGVSQTFYAPAGATRLFLGFPDAPYFQGNPGSYADNQGSLSLGVTAVPEPGTMTLLLTALGALFTWRVKSGRGCD